MQQQYGNKTYSTTAKIYVHAKPTAVTIRIYIHPCMHKHQSTVTIYMYIHVHSTATWANNTIQYNKCSNGTSYFNSVLTSHKQCSSGNTYRPLELVCSHLAAISATFLTCRHHHWPYPFTRRRRLHDVSYRQPATGHEHGHEQTHPRPQVEITFEDVIGVWLTAVHK